MGCGIAAVYSEGSTAVPWRVPFRHARTVLFVTMQATAGPLKARDLTMSQNRAELALPEFGAGLH